MKKWLDHGRCPTCGRTITVTTKGNVYAHRTMGLASHGWCKGGKAVTRRLTP